MNQIDTAFQILTSLLISSYAVQNGSDIETLSSILEQLLPSKPGKIDYTIKHTKSTRFVLKDPTLTDLKLGFILLQADLENRAIRYILHKELI